jgi:serine/threonine protein kinase
MVRSNIPHRLGRYEVVDRIGEGGMGTLYLARDPLLQRTVAIKVLSVPNEDLRERFAREARSVAALNHQHIVTIYDVGEQDGVPFIAMEYVQGETLAEIIRRGSPLPLTDKLQVMLELCSGLGHAHRAGIIHRDIKPANVMLSTDRVVKILDFGLARVVADAGISGLTAAGTLLGTPHYMSPEQIEGRPADQRSDIFAVGLMLYEFLSYRKAFPGETPHYVIHRIMNAEPQPLRELDESLDPELEQVVLKAIQKLPEQRYQDLRLLADDLVRIRDRVPASGNPKTVLFARPEPTKRKPSSPESEPQQTPRQIPNLDAIARRRATQIEAHLNVALDHLQHGRLEEAVEQCELAVVLDPQNARALDLLHDAHKGLDDRQVRTWVLEAETQLSKSALSEASLLIDQILLLRPDSSAAAVLQRTLEDRRREQERARERARTVGIAVERARRSLADGAPEAAFRAAGEALAYEPAHAEALALKARAGDAIEEQRQRQQQHQQRASEAVAAARQFANDGDMRRGLGLLQAFAPTHPDVEKAADELAAEILASEQRARVEEMAREQREREDEARQHEAERLALELEKEDQAHRRQEAEVRAQTLLATKKKADDLPRRPEAMDATEDLEQEVTQELDRRAQIDDLAPPQIDRPPAAAESVAAKHPAGARRLQIKMKPVMAAIALLFVIVAGGVVIHRIVTGNNESGPIPSTVPPPPEAPRPPAGKPAVSSSPVVPDRGAAPPRGATVPDRGATKRRNQLDTVAALIKQGDAHFEQRRYTEAVRSYNRALAEDPQNAAAREKLRVALKARTDSTERATLGPKPDSPATSDPNRAAQLKRQANALLQTGLFERAIPIFQEILKTNPSDPDALAGLEKAIALRNQQKP